MLVSTRRGFLKSLMFDGEGPAGTAPSATLVCIFLRGAADTLNMLVPYGEDAYYRARPTLAISPPAISNISSAVRLDDFYGLHPSMSSLLQPYSEGRLAFIQGVGSDNPTGSHFDAQDQMEHGDVYGRTIGGGWLGRYLRTRNLDTSPLSAVAMGSTIPEALRTAPSATAIDSVEDVQLKAPAGRSSEIAALLASLYQADTGVLRKPGETTLSLLKRVDDLRGKTYTPEAGAKYLDDPFSHGLKQVARLVKSNVGLEVACVDLGGWDTHFFQGGATGIQADSIRQLSGGLAAFDADLKKVESVVITIVMTEFGRRSYENASLGTDHGRGFAFMALGNRVRGGKVYGSWNGLAEEDIPGPGGLKIQFDYRRVLTEVISAGMGHSDPALVFPGAGDQKIGFISHR